MSNLTWSIIYHIAIYSKNWVHLLHNHREAYYDLRYAVMKRKPYGMSSKTKEEGPTPISDLCWSLEMTVGE